MDACNQVRYSIHSRSYNGFILASARDQHSFHCLRKSLLDIEELLFCIFFIELAIIVGIEPLRKSYALDVRTSLQKQFTVLDGSLHACSISVIYHDNRLCKAHDKSYLVIRKRCPGTSYYVLDPILMKSDYIKLPLYQVSKPLFAIDRLA